MTQILTRAHVENFPPQARLTRDPRQIEPFLDDNVDWLVTGPVELLHFCGQRRGKAEVLDCITPTGSRRCSNVLKVGVDGPADRPRSRARRLAGWSPFSPATGRTISYHQAQFMRFRDGKIIEYRAIIDSFDAAEQMMGHPIALPDMPRARYRADVLAHAIGTDQASFDVGTAEAPDLGLIQLTPWRASTARTASTSLSSSDLVLRLGLLLAGTPRDRTAPAWPVRLPRSDPGPAPCRLAFSSAPWITAHGLPRRSA